MGAPTDWIASPSSRYEPLSQTRKYVSLREKTRGRLKGDVIVGWGHDKGSMTGSTPGEGRCQPPGSLSHGVARENVPTAGVSAETDQGYLASAARRRAVCRYRSI